MRWFWNSGLHVERNTDCLGRKLSGAEGFGEIAAECKALQPSDFLKKCENIFEGKREDQRATKARNFVFIFLRFLQFISNCRCSSMRTTICLKHMKWKILLWFFKNMPSSPYLTEHHNWCPRPKINAFLFVLMEKQYIWQNLYLLNELQILVQSKYWKLQCKPTWRK